MARKLIVGLGNPGANYKNTKHNAGFWVVEAIAKELDVSVNQRKFNSLWAQGKIDNISFILVKPLTYMNLSGNAVRNFIDYFKIDLSDVLIIFDDVHLKLGTIRIRKFGSAGGHNGLRSIIKDLGTSEVSRLRFGVNAAMPGVDLAKYVLSGFSNKEDEQIAKVTVEQAKNAAMSWLENDINFAMNKFNTKGRENSDDE
ncbi:MAG: aminoacyl-tRNA hydrolase [Candidatus Omnitrophica bacterium]|nr:aminoacyl-tRNA hydrolase [Candidatus Omnitrophota bacterium]